MQNLQTKYPHLEKYQITKELEKTSHYSIYCSTNLSKNTTHIIKVIEIPNIRSGKVSLFVQKMEKLLPYLEELPNNISYDSIYYEKKTKQFILVYQNRTSFASNSLKIYFHSKNSKILITPEQALYQFVIILANYNALLRRMKTPFTLSLESIIQIEATPSIDYIGAQIMDILFCEQLVDENLIKNSIGKLLYSILSQSRREKSKTSESIDKIHLLNDKSDDNGLNEILKLFLEKNNLELAEAISQALSKLKDKINLSDISKQFLPLQLEKLSYFLNIPQNQYLISTLETQLKNCIFYNNYSLMQKLVHQNQSKLKDVNGSDTLNMAVQQNQLQSFIFLLSQFKVSPEFLNQCAYVSCQLGHLDLIKYLIQELKVDANKKFIDGLTPLLLSAQNGHLEIVKYLIEEVKVNPNQQDDLRIAPYGRCTSLILSAYNGHLQIIKYLIEEVGVDPNQPNMWFLTPLMASAQNGHLQIVKYLIEEVKVDPNQGDRYRPALLLSAQNGYLHIIKYLIEEVGVHPNQSSFQGETSLIVSAENGQLQVVKYLIEEVGVDPNQSTSFSRNTLLMLSARNGHLQVVKYLIEVVKVDPNQTNRERSTPLIFSTLSGCLELVQYLIEEVGVNPNIADNNGKTNADLDDLTLGESILTNMGKECPEIVRIMIYEEKEFDFNQSNRLRYRWKQKKFHKALDVLNSI